MAPGQRLRADECRVFGLFFWGGGADQVDAWVPRPSSRPQSSNLQLEPTWSLLAIPEVFQGPSQQRCALIQWYRLVVSNHRPLDPQSSALTY